MMWMYAEGGGRWGEGRSGGEGGGEEEKKNSITNRPHLHGFHQPISSCQTELLLIGLEGKRTEERAWRTTWEAELRTAGCSCLINQSGGFFSLFFCSAQGCGADQKQLADCDTNKI